MTILNYEGTVTVPKAQTQETDTSPDCIAVTSVDLQAQKFTLAWILMNKKKMYSDRRLLQRLLCIWPQDKRDSYLSDILNGKSQKDLFILARISPILKELYQRLEDEQDENKKQAIQGNIDYFEALQKAGYEYLVIDGQHRLDNLVKFFNAKPGEFVPLISGGPQYRFKIKTAKGDYVPFDVCSSPFYEWPESVKQIVLNKIPFLFSIVTEGDIKELKLLFVGANDGEPLSMFEKLIIESYGETVRFIMDLIDTDEKIGNPIWQLEYKDKFKGMSGHFKIDKRGDALMYSEELYYICNDYKPVSSKIEFLREIYADDYFLSKTIQTRMKMSLAVRSLGCKDQSKIADSTRVNSGNAHIMLCIMDDKSHPAREGLTDLARYEVVKGSEKSFMDWFWEYEARRKATNPFLKDATGNFLLTHDGKKIKNPDSYLEHCRFSWENLAKRHSEIAKDFVEHKDWLEGQGIIRKVGVSFSNPAKHRVEMAVQQGFLDEFGEEISFFDDLSGENPKEVGHIVPKSFSGTPEDGRKLIGKTRNIRESNK